MAGGVAVMMAAGHELKRTPRARAALRMSFDVFANEGARMLKMPAEAASRRDEDAAERAVQDPAARC